MNVRTQMHCGIVLIWPISRVSPEPPTPAAYFSYPFFGHVEVVKARLTVITAYLDVVGDVKKGFLHVDARRPEDPGLENFGEFGYISLHN
jgi:hypothetical protein